MVRSAVRTCAAAVVLAVVASLLVVAPSGAAVDGPHLASARAGRVPNPLVSLPPAAGVPFDPQSDVSGLAPAGYVQEEFFTEGTARAYRPVGTWGTSGAWTAELSGAIAAYRTRMLVRRPADRTKFNGTVLVEWLNVSSTLDTAPDWGFGRAELLRQGYAWVGVSAQAVGVNTLKGFAPARYGTLVHPGDTYSFDIYSQAAQAIADPTGIKPLADLRVKRMIADGESQSAGRMTTYFNAVQPLEKRFDSFMIHSRGARPTPISQAPEPTFPMPAFTLVRTDQRAPVIVFLSETDVPSNLAARQPDSRRYRLWEVPGTAHVDKYMLGAVGQAALNCSTPINAGPEHFVFETAIRSLDRWMRRSDYSPPKADRLATDPTTGAILRDANGNALGGIRTPQLDVPVATHSGFGNVGGGFCGLAGSTIPFDAAKLASLYPSRAAYERLYLLALVDALQSRFVLKDDVLAIWMEAVESPVVG